MELKIILQILLNIIINNGEISGNIYDANIEELVGIKITTESDTTYTDLYGGFCIPYNDTIKLSMISYKDIRIKLDSNDVKYNIIKKSSHLSNISLKNN